MKDDFQPATFRQKIFLVCGLILITALGLGIGAWVLERVEEPLRREVWVPWTAPSGIVLKAEGPVSLWLDDKKQRLIHRGPIDSKTKDALLTLLEAQPPSAETGARRTSAPVSAVAVRSYRQAIDRLTFLSNQQTETSILFLLLLGGIGGVVGVQLRSVSNFIGVACVKNRLDFKRWWPWYALRPLLGFLVGVLVVVLTKSDLYTPEGPTSEANLWWLGLAVLAGFGAEDFGLRLRLISHTLFGVSEMKTDGRKDEEENADEEPGGGRPGQSGRPTRDKIEEATPEKSSSESNVNVTERI